MLNLRNIGVIFLFLFLSNYSYASDQLRIVGSSTVFPFSIEVAEDFGQQSKFSAPVVESTGSGGGIKLFCEQKKGRVIDFVNASRPMYKPEYDLCRKNAVEPVEVEIGYDGIVLARSKNGKYFEPSLRHLYLALAKQVPIDGKLVINPYKKWSDIDKSFPKERILVYGPPPTSGTRDAFTEIVMEKGALSFDFIRNIKKSSKKDFKAIATTLREDGAFIESGENDNLIVGKLKNNKIAVGIFGFSYFDENKDALDSLGVEGVRPSRNTIADGSYLLSRKLYFYFNAHFTEDRREQIVGYIDTFMGSDASGKEGYLIERGLIPLDIGDSVKVIGTVNKVLGR